MTRRPQIDDRLLRRLILISSVLFWGLSACSLDAPFTDAPFRVDVPAGFPAIDYPDDNYPEAARIALGKELFFDPILSVDSSIACVDCHHPEWAFADHTPISSGVEGRIGFRNSSTLANVAYVPVMTMDGGSPTIEQQLYIPLEDFHEMAFNMVLLTERLQNNAYYSARFKEVFEAAPSPFGISRAIASFERTILSGLSRYDQYLTGSYALNTSEKRGMDLFFSDELSCASCHAGTFFSDFSFQNNGLYEVYSPDSGRARITLNPADAGKFKVPTLRNIAVTWPYMHDGSMLSLEDVIDHYNQGGADHPNKSALVKPLGLSEADKSGLIHFLEMLTDETFLQDKAFIE